jgi:hypothetical protein
VELPEGKKKRMVPRRRGAENAPTSGIKEGNIMSRFFPASTRPPGVCVVALLVGAWTANLARAELRFPEAKAHAGEVRAGLPLTHSFPFINDGPEAVEILEAQPSCGCLVPRVEKRVYQPGERSSLRVEVNTLTQTAGPQTWRVLVRYRRGESLALVALQLTAQVVAEIRVQPAALTIFADFAVRQEILFTDTRPQPLAVTALQATSAKLTARLGDVGRDGHGHGTRKILLEVPDDFPEGRHEEVLHITTNDPAYRDLKVPVTVIKRLRQRVAALPNQVAWGGSMGAALPAQIVRLRDQGNEPVIVEHVVSDDPALACSWAAGPGTMATLKITVDRKRRSDGEWRSAVHVHIAKPVREIVTIPVEVLGH